MNIIKIKYVCMYVREITDMELDSGIIEEWNIYLINIIENQSKKSMNIKRRASQGQRKIRRLMEYGGMKSLQ